jgi:hypothetical protein
MKAETILWKNISRYRSPQSTGCDLKPSSTRNPHRIGYHAVRVPAKNNNYFSTK